MSVEANEVRRPRRGDAWRLAGVAVVLAVAVAVVFREAGDLPFILFDDPVYVTENPRVREGLSRHSVLWALGSVGYAGNWHPLTWWSHMLDVEMFGVDAARHHRVNVLFHALAAVALFIALAKAIARDRAFRDRATAIAAFVAAVFAVHPLRLESVVWVSERKDVLSGLFGFLAILAYVRWVERPRAARYVTVCALMALALMSKPMWVTLPAILVLLDLWPLGRFSGVAERSRWRTIGALAVEKIPLVLLSVGATMLTVSAQRAGGAVSTLQAVTVTERVANGAVWYLRYVGKMLWPANLAIYYPFPVGGVPRWEVVLAGAALMAITAASILAVRRRPWVTVGWSWYVIALVPVIGIVHIGMHGGADRYTYVPQVGLYLILACGLAEAARRLALPRAVVLGIALVIVAACGVGTIRQMKFWHSSETLFSRAIAVIPDNYVAHYGLGVALADSGRDVEAEAHYREALRLHPQYAAAHRDLGRLLSGQGRAEEARVHLSESVRLEPHNGRAHVELGLAHHAAGRHQQAVRAFELAVQMDPLSVEAHNQLGVSLEWLGQVDRAVDAYDAATHLRPDLFEPHLNLGGALARLGRFSESLDAFRAAVRLRPDAPDARLGLGVAAFMSGDLDTAHEQHDILRDLAPEVAGRLRVLLEEEPGSGVGDAPGRPPL